MRHLAIALVCVTACTAAQARGHHSTTAYTTSGPALRTVHAGLPKWAAAPTPYALGHYAPPHAAPQGRSTSRVAHINALQHCNPFANVSATRALAACN